MSTFAARERETSLCTGHCLLGGTGDLDTDPEEDVVSVVAGMGSLITDSLALTSLTVRMEEVMLFAVTRSELEDKIGPNTGEHQHRHCHLHLHIVASVSLLI